MSEGTVVAQAMSPSASSHHSSHYAQEITLLKADLQIAHDDIQTLQNELNAERHLTSKLNKDGL